MKTATSREVLNIYRSRRTTEQEIALIEFMELTETERWELLFFGAIDATHIAQAALGRDGKS